MSNYFYSGVTAYLKNNDQTNVNLSLLAEAIFQLQPFIERHENDFTHRTDILGDGAFRFIAANDTLFTNPALAFPQQTPESFQSVDLSTVTIGGNELVRLHMPVISEDPDEVTYMVDEALLYLLEKLFGTDLVCAKEKSGTDWDEFALLTEEVRISAKRFVPTA